MTQLVPQQDLTKLIAARGISLQEVLDTLAIPEKAEPTPAPTAPQVIVLSPDVKKILRTVGKKVADLNLPSKPRMLTEAERAAFIPIFDEVKKGRAALEKAEAALKDVFHHHLDRDYLRHLPELEPGQEPVPIPYDQHGHIAVKGEVTAEGLPVKVVRDERGGHAEPLTEANLAALEAEGVIDHAAYLRMTKRVNAPRAVKEDGVMKELATNPELLKKMAEVVSMTPRETAMRVAKV